MSLRRTPALICSSTNLPTFIWPFYSITSSSLTPISRCSNLQNTRAGHQKHARRYATAHDMEKKHTGLPSSCDWPACQNPTPYQIFDQRRDAPYSKSRFYELVKLYHPDRHRQIPGDTLTSAVRLERYRLVVAANEILSDPSKRRNYDLYGAGWGSSLLMDNSHLRQAERSWRNEPGNPSMNATWEDWERWYGERSGDGTKQKQQTVFMSNELFVVILCMFVVAGSMSQARRASVNTMNLVEVRDRRHAAISQDLAKRRTEQGSLGREERIESFLRQREGWDLPSSCSTHQVQPTAVK